MNWNTITFIWINLLFCGLLGVLGSYAGDMIGETFPSRVEIEVGDSVNISCRMILETFPNRTSKDLYFMNENIHERVSKSSILEVSNTTITFMLRNAQEQQSVYRCYCGIDAIMDTIVSVGYKPLLVKDFTCRAYDFIKMQCNFTKPHNPVLTQYNSSFYFTKTYKYYPNCSLEGFPVICETSLNYRASEEIYHYELIASNALGEQIQHFEINNTKIMVLATPGQDFREEEITPDSALFSFRMNKFESTYRSKGLKWEVLLNDSFGSYNLSSAVHQNSRVRNEFQVRLQNLKYAFHSYRLQLRVRLLGAQEWSAPFVYEFQTAPRRPERAPRVDVGAFYTDPTETTIRLYWELLLPHEFNGRNFTYLIEQVKPDGKHSPHMEPNSAVFEWRKDMEYEFILRSKNHLGLSNTQSKISVPAMIPHIKIKTHTPTDVHNVYHGTNGTYTLTWWAPEATVGLIDYTIFWCRSKRALLNGCEGSIHFQHVASTVHKFTTTPQEHTLNLAVSANYINFNTGMHWTECTMDEESDLVKMEPEIEATSSTAIKIQWGSEKVCPSIFERYNLSFCETTTEEMRDESNFDYGNGFQYNCKEGTVNYVLINKTRNRYELQNLKPYTTYKIEMFMYSLRKVGKTSDPQTVRTFEGEPSHPRQLNVSRLTNTSAFLSWLPPREPNGVIRSYIVVVNNERRKIDADKDESSSGRIEYELKELNSSTLYKVYVLAKTVSVSQPSNDIHFTTLIGYPPLPHAIHVRDGSTEAATIEWSKPTERTDYHEVVITLLNNDEVISRRISVVIGKNACTYNIPKCVDRMFRTTVDIRAVNAALLTHEDGFESMSDENSVRNEPDERYYHGFEDLQCSAKLSDTENQRYQEQLNRYMNPKYYRLYKTAWQRGTLYSCSSEAFSKLILYIASFLLFAVVIFVIIYLARHKYNKMANIHCSLPAGIDAYMTKDFSIVNGNFPHDLIAVIKGEKLTTRIENNISCATTTTTAPQRTDCAYTGSSRHNEERRLLETASQDSVSLNEHSNLPTPTPHEHTQNAIHKTEIENNLENAPQAIEMNFECQPNMRHEIGDSNYVQATGFLHGTPQSHAGALPPITENCYIRPNSIAQWQNLATQPAQHRGGYVTAESINTPEPQSLCKPINNAYIRAEALETLKVKSPTSPNETLSQAQASPLFRSSDSYTTIEQLNKKPAFNAGNWEAPDTDSARQSLNAEIPLHFTPGISGYVTQKELNVFGQQHQQNSIN